METEITKSVWFKRCGHTELVPLSVVMENIRTPGARLTCPCCGKQSREFTASPVSEQRPAAAQGAAT
jgi:hypothetical protein